MTKQYIDGKAMEYSGKQQENLRKANDSFVGTVSCLMGWSHTANRLCRFFHSIFVLESDLSLYSLAKFCRNICRPHQLQKLQEKHLFS